MMRRILRGFTLAAALVVAAIAIAPAPAGAVEWTEPSTWGAGLQLSTTGNNDGNVVKLWQHILHVRFGGWCSPGECSPDISGHFGSITKNYTTLWQTQHGLTADGIVGNNTWNTARWLHLGPKVYIDSSWYWYEYRDIQSVWYVDIRFARPYATWLMRWCGTNYHVTAPQISAGYFSNCD